MTQRSTTPSVGEATKQSFAANVVADIDDLYPEVTAITNADSPYTAVAESQVIRVSTSGGAVTINLPAASEWTGLVITVHLHTAGSILTVDPDGSEVFEDGSSTKTYDAAGTVVEFQSDGTRILTLADSTIAGGGGGGGGGGTDGGLGDTGVSSVSSASVNSTSYSDVPGLSTSLSAVDSDAAVLVNVTGHYQADSTNNVYFVLHLDGSQISATEIEDTPQGTGATRSCFALTYLLTGHGGGAIACKVQAKMPGGGTVTVDKAVITAVEVIPPS